ncbi:hypothetical protein SAMN05444421_11361 [Celeribacter marinus]|nr:hypothetical protein SAMN05444421_11361 [Celeribacter marinus]
MAFFLRLHETFGQGTRVSSSPGSLGELTRRVSAEWAVAVGPFRSWFGAIQWQPTIAHIRTNSCQVISARSYGQLVIISLADGREHP